jgi:hypothetical protein
VRAGDELQAPVGYDGPWVALAVLSLVLVAVYYGAVVWWGRRAPAPHVVRAPRQESLTELDRIGTDVSGGRVTPRVGHQRISETVRGFVASASGVPARTMTLADLEDRGPAELAAMVALLYPPEFAADPALAGEQFGAALARARELVSSWT